MAGQLRAHHPLRPDTRDTSYELLDDGRARFIKSTQSGTRYFSS